MNGSHPKIRQRKRLGQIFLKDENTLKKIVTFVDKKESDLILEVGAGSGILTEKLLELDKPVLAIEIDSGWANVLKKKFTNNKNFTLIVGDILKLNFNKYYQNKKILFSSLFFLTNLSSFSYNYFFMGILIYVDANKNFHYFFLRLYFFCHCC